MGYSGLVPTLGKMNHQLNYSTVIIYHHLPSTIDYITSNLENPSMICPEKGTVARCPNWVHPRCLRPGIWWYRYLQTSPDETHEQPTHACLSMLTKTIKNYYQELLTVLKIPSDRYCKLFLFLRGCHVFSRFLCIWYMIWYSYVLSKCFCFWCHLNIWESYNEAWPQRFSDLVREWCFWAATRCEHGVVELCASARGHPRWPVDIWFHMGILIHDMGWKWVTLIRMLIEHLELEQLEHIDHVSVLNNGHFGALQCQVVGVPTLPRHLAPAPATAKSSEMGLSRGTLPIATAGAMLAMKQKRQRETWPYLLEFWDLYSYNSTDIQEGPKKWSGKFTNFLPWLQHVVSFCVAFTCIYSLLLAFGTTVDLGAAPRSAVFWAPAPAPNF